MPSLSKLLDLDTDSTVTLTLNMTQLTDIRVSCLHRMDALKRSIEGDQQIIPKAELETTYVRTRAMLDDGGILQLALHRFIVNRHKSVK